MKLDKAVFRLMIGIISMCCLTSLFAFPSQAWASKELDVPYIRQVGDTADEFDGRWACGATSAVMITAYYNKLPFHRISVNMCGFHYSDYGWYVSEIYSRYGYTFDTETVDASGDAAYGAYGYIHYPNGYAHPRYARGYFRKHGLFSKLIGNRDDADEKRNPTFDEVKSMIDKGHPVWASTNLWPSGHIVVIIGYTENGSLIVHDPGIHGDLYCGMGNNKIYSWSELQTESKWIVTTDPIAPGDRVRALYDYINVRNEPRPDAPIIGSQRMKGDEGTIVDDATYGCFYNSGTGYTNDYTWWKIRWDDGTEGWSACCDKADGDNWIEKVTTAETLSVSLTADPSSGNAPLDVTLTADVSGTATGTINYTFWWNCNDPGTSVDVVMNVCGYIPTPSPGSCASNENGIKCDGVIDDPKIISHTYSSPGTYTAKVITERGSVDPAEDRVTIIAINHDPELNSGDVDPDSGDTSTTFTYTVKYYDQDGDSPSAKYVYIDGSPHTMSLYTGSASNGTYRYRTTLSAGSHNYYFYFTDGNGDSDRLPSSGTYSGPDVSPPPDTPPDTTITSGPSGTIDYNDVGFSWTGSDDVTPTSDLLYSYKLEGYDSDWSGYSPSTTKSYNDLPNGSYTFYVKAKDEAGNVDPSPASRSFTVNVYIPDTPPDTTITSGPSGTIDYNDVGFSWTGSDDVTPTSDLLYSYKLEGYDSDWSGYSPSTTKSYNDLPNGSYTFYVKAKDEAGNVDPSPASRSFTVNVCTYSISPKSKHFGPSGGTGTINVTTQAGCSWTAVNHAGWITITAGRSGTGSGIVYYSVSENSSTSSRTGTITIADKTFTVTQSGTSMPWLHLLLGE